MKKNLFLLWLLHALPLCLLAQNFRMAPEYCALEIDFEDAINENEETYCRGNVVVASVLPNDDPTIPGISHGTPRVVSEGCSEGSTKGLLMGVNGGYCSESIFFNFRFETGKIYYITFRTKYLSTAIPAIPSNYRLHVRAVNGLVHDTQNTAQCPGTDFACGGYPVNQNAGTPLDGSPLSYTVLSNDAAGCVENTLEFTSPGNFSQLWFLPQNISGDTRNAGLVLVDLCVRVGCKGTNITFKDVDPTIDIKGGNHRYTDWIKTTSNGVGLVTNDQNANTTLIAGEYISFGPNTQFTASGNKYLLACIQTCSYGLDNDSFVTNEDRSNADIPSKLEDFILIPNPNGGDFEINIRDFHKNTDKVLSAKILNSLGQLIHTEPIVNNRQRVNLSSQGLYANGIYFVVIEVDGKPNLVKKMIIQN